MTKFEERLEETRKVAAEFIRNKKTGRLRSCIKAGVDWTKRNARDIGAVTGMALMAILPAWSIINSLTNAGQNGGDMTYCDYYAPETLFSNERITEKTREEMETEFLLRRNTAVNSTNKHLAEWNNEFDAMYPGVGGLTAEYGEFLASKMQPVIDEVNASHYGRDAVELFASTEPATAGDIQGRIKSDGSTMILTLRPVKRINC